MTSNIRNIFIASVICAIFLFFLGFNFSSGLVISHTDNLLTSLGYTRTIIPSEIFWARIYFGIYVSLCSPIAIGMSWVRAKGLSSGITMFTFIICLFIAIGSLFLGYWLRFMDLKLSLGPSTIPNTDIMFDSMNYFSWGMKTLLIVCTSVSFLLYITGRKKRVEIEAN